MGLHDDRSRRPVDRPLESQDIRRPHLVHRASVRRFCVQYHGAAHLHYDFRLEMGGVLKSWAVPRGPTMDPDVRRLAVEAEDHPLDYLTFEGNLPIGSPGAGDVIVWDLGTYTVEADRPPVKELERGRLRFRLQGQKLRGEFVLVRMAADASPSRQRQWVLMKLRDGEEVFGDSADLHPGSVLRPSAPTPPAPDSAPVVRMPVAPEPVYLAPVEGSSLNPADLPGAEASRSFPDVALMLGSPAPAPFSAPRWLFEILWDGLRTRVHLDSGQTRLLLANGLDVTARFPELQSVAASLREAGMATERALLDAMIIAPDEAGRASLRRLQPRIAASTPAGFASGQTAFPVVLVAFDLLYLNGYSLLNVTLAERKRVLEALIPESMQERLRYSHHMAEEGERLYELVRRRGIDGIIAKQADSPYQPGRGQLWLTVRATPRQPMAIVGYTRPRNRPDGLQALLLALYDSSSRRFRLAGRVSSGLDLISRRQLLDRLRPVKKAPATGDAGASAASVQWVTPDLVAEISAQGWTKQRQLRRPEYLGLRPDLNPKDCQSAP